MLFASRTRGLSRRAIAALVVTGLAASAMAGPINAAKPIDYTIANDVPGFVAQATDLGSAATTDVATVTVWLSLGNENKLSQLVSGQETPGSGSYHKWLTQADFNAQFSRRPRMSRRSRTTCRRRDSPSSR